MALPGHRRTASDRDKRRSHDALKKLNLGTCKGCGVAVLPHITCRACGMYGGRKVLTVKTKTSKPKS